MEGEMKALVLVERCACWDTSSWDGVTSGCCAGQGQDDQENCIRTAGRLHIYQSSWLNTAAEEQIPYISSLRPKLAGICGAAELHTFEIKWRTYGCTRKCFQVFPSLGSWFPSSLLSHLDTYELLVHIKPSFCPLLASSMVWETDSRTVDVLKKVKLMCSSNRCLAWV